MVHPTVTMAADDDSEPALPHIGGPLDPINDAFHDDYAQARAQAERRAPVLVLLGDELTLVHGDPERPRAVLSVTPRVYHALKSIAHLPAGVFAILQRSMAEPTRSTDVALARMLALVRAALLSLPDDVPGPEPQQLCRELLERAQTFIGEVMQVGVSPARLDAFARASGPRLMQLADHATRTQLEALHRCASELFAQLSQDERAQLHVVVAGAHQARARSLGMQYFARMLGQGDGEDEDEERVSYAESVDTVEDAVALIGMQRLDRVMARAFFGDEKRLQRDVLGDAAKRILEAADLQPLTLAPR